MNTGAEGMNGATHSVGMGIDGLGGTVDGARGVSMGIEGLGGAVDGASGEVRAWA